MKLGDIKGDAITVDQKLVTKLTDSQLVGAATASIPGAMSATITTASLLTI